MESTHDDGVPIPGSERPGVPREAAPSRDDGATAAPPPSWSGQSGQSGQGGRPSELRRSTPVFGTAQPLHGTSGRVRRWAYSIPEHRGRHWMLLMAADRVDVIEDRVAGAFGRVLRTVGRDDVARKVARDPLPVLAGALLGGLLTGWILARR